MLLVGKYKIEVTEEHLDIFGHVNVIHYYKFFDEAKWHYSTHNGFGLDVVNRLNQGPILLEQTVSFLREINLGESVEIHTMATEHGLKRTKGIQLIFKPCGNLAAKSHFILGYFDMSKRRLVALSPEWKKSTPIVEEC